MAQKPEPGPVGQTDEDRVTLPVWREEIQLGTRIVDTGRGARIHKRVVEHPQQIDQTLWHDELEVRHVPVDTPVAGPDLPPARYEGDTLIVPVFEEILVVEKRYRIKEELHIVRHRRSHRHAETVLLKSEEVVVERFDDSSDLQKS